MLNIALVTSTKNHHYFWAYELHKEFNIKLILLHKKNKGERVKKLLLNKKPLYYGGFWFFLKCISFIYHKISSKSFSKDLERKEEQYFGIYKEKFKEIPLEKIHYIDTINSPNALDLIKSNEIDIICFLGGDIAKKPIINAPRLASLNYHSGISPLYNGSQTIFHAISDFRPNLAGGTLMYINERLDGGSVLAHYLPEIKQDDTPSDLFLKNIRGAVNLYRDYFKYLENNDKPEGVKQERYFKYVRNIDWTFINDIKLNKIKKYNILKKYIRSEVHLHHFDLKNNEMAKVIARIYSKTFKKKL